MTQDQRFPDRLRAAFEQHGIRREYRRGATLFRVGSAPAGLHLVERGHIRIVRGRSRPVVLHYEGPGGMLGETALFGGTPYPATAIASEPTVCHLLPTGRVWQLLAEDPEAAVHFLRRLATRLGGVIDRLDGMSRTSVAARLAHHLLGRPGVREGRPISLGMTQTELAEELGTVREVVVRELRRLRGAGLVRSAGRGLYRVSDPEGLAAIGS